MARRPSGRLTAPGRLLALVESEVAAGWVLLRAGRFAEVMKVLKTPVDMFEDIPDDRDIDPDARTQAMWWRALGQASLLLGRAHLALGEVEPASRRLGQAVVRLRQGSAHELLGMAKICQGQCARLRGEWTRHASP